MHFSGDRALLRALTRWTAVFPWAVMSTLRGESNLGPALEELGPAQVEAARDAQHPALLVAQRMTGCLLEARQRGLITDITQASLDGNIQLLIDYLGGCERIRKTPRSLTWSTFDVR